MSDSEEHRLRFILDGQQHCDHFLTPIASPRGKRVLVAGSGAGTEMLWCLRHGAAEVFGVDLAPQTEHALRTACEQLGVGPNFTMQQMAIEDAARLGRKFDLVLSNNVFEHVSDLPRSFAACAQLVEREGRVAIFTDPLFHSSAGSHLDHQPWEHLWGKVDYEQNMLNRMRLTDFLDAMRGSGLVLLNLRVVRDRNVTSLAQYRDRVPHIAAMDLAIEGIAVELAHTDATDFMSTEERLMAEERTAHHAHVAELETLLQREREARAAERGQLTASVAHWEQTAAEVKRVLDSVEQSASFRIGRTITAPLKMLSARRRPRRP